jgi:hypothetical protein
MASIPSLQGFCYFVLGEVPLQHLQAKPESARFGVLAGARDLEGAELSFHR